MFRGGGGGGRGNLMFKSVRSSFAGPYLHSVSRADNLQWHLCTGGVDPFFWPERSWLLLHNNQPDAHFVHQELHLCVKFLLDTVPTYLTNPGCIIASRCGKPSPIFSRPYNPSWISTTVSPDPYRISRDLSGLVLHTTLSRARPYSRAPRCWRSARARPSYARRSTRPGPPPTR